jgi:hypothetical protein
MLLAVGVLAVILALSSAQNAFAPIQELRYDDGTSPYPPGAENLGTWGAVKFVLSDFGLSDPTYQLLQVSFYTVVYSPPCPSEIHIFDSTGVTELLVPAATITPTNPSLEWIAVDLSSENVMVSGSFYVAIRSECGFSVMWDPIPNSLIPPSPARTYGAPSGYPPAWSLDEEDNLMFRAIVGSTAAPPVGGVAIPANTLAILGPWLAVIGVVGCIGTIVVIAKKRQS